VTCIGYFHSDYSLHLVYVRSTAVLYCILSFLVLWYKFLGASDYYYHLNTGIVFWFEELLLLWFFLLSIFVPQTVAVNTLYKWVWFKKFSVFLCVLYQSDRNSPFFKHWYLCRTKCRWRTPVKMLNTNIYYQNIFFIDTFKTSTILNPYEYLPVLLFSTFHLGVYGLIWMKYLLYLCNFLKELSYCWETFILWIKVKWELFFTNSLLPWSWNKFLCCIRSSKWFMVYKISSFWGDWKNWQEEFWRLESS
jgi:hypothetical protein